MGLQLDDFVKVPDLNIAQGRAVILNSIFTLYAARDGTIEQVRREPATAWRVDRRNTIVTLESGEQIVLTKLGGCACGSPLKRINPYA